MLEDVEQVDVQILKHLVGSDVDVVVEEVIEDGGANHGHERARDAVTRAVCADDHVYAAIGARPIEVTADDVAWHVESIASAIAKTFEEIEIWQDGLLDTERVVDAICDFLILLFNGLVLLTQLLSLPVDLTFEHLLLVAKDTLFLSVSFAFEERKSNYCGKENRYGDEDPHLPLRAEEGRSLLVLDLFVLQLIDIHDGLHILDLAGVP